MQYVLNDVYAARGSAKIFDDGESILTTSLEHDNIELKDELIVDILQHFEEHIEIFDFSVLEPKQLFVDFDKMDTFRENFVGFKTFPDIDECSKVQSICEEMVSQLNDDLEQLNETLFTL